MYIVIVINSCSNAVPALHVKGYNDDVDSRYREIVDVSSTIAVIIPLSSGELEINIDEHKVI